MGKNERYELFMDLEILSKNGFFLYADGDYSLDNYRWVKIIGDLTKNPKNVCPKIAFILKEYPKSYWNISDEGLRILKNIGVVEKNIVETLIDKHNSRISTEKGV